jgi:hypothetical protein
MAGGISRYLDGSTEVDEEKSEALISSSIRAMEYEQRKTDTLIGLIDQNGEYRSRMPDSEEIVKEIIDSMKYSIPADLPNPTSTYRSKLSVNISVAARNMKRRTLGLPVVDPDDVEAAAVFYQNGGRLLTY